MRKQYRQGDVLLLPVYEVPSGAKVTTEDGRRVILAYGEVTGHAHAIQAPIASVYRSGVNDYLSVPAGAVLRHEEHAELPIEPGIYRVVRQREYEAASWRQVAD